MTLSGNIIKNPLTIIAIFAGIVEVGSNVVLPFLTAENQSTYIWFLMLFPFVLVLIFFYILYNKHEVLYAPSDYNDESNFKDILNNTRKSTPKEVDKKNKDEYESLKEQTKKLELEQNKHSSNEASIINLSTKFEKFSELFRTKRRFIHSIESKLLDLFSSKYFIDSNFQKYITLETVNRDKLISDAFIKEENNINIIEVKILSRYVPLRHMIKRFIDAQYNVLQTLSLHYNITLSFIILTPDDDLKNRYERLEEMLNNKFENFNIKIYPNIITEIEEKEIKYLDLLKNEINLISLD